MGAAEKRPRGRSTKLTPELRAELLDRLAGAGLAEAATASGISERTLRSWRRRAWSPRPEGHPYVELEQRLRDTRASSTLDPEAWRSTAELLEENERATAGLSWPSEPALAGYDRLPPDRACVARVWWGGRACREPVAARSWILEDDLRSGWAMASSKTTLRE